MTPAAQQHTPLPLRNKVLAGFRLAAAPFVGVGIVAAAVLQGFIVGPVFKNYNVIPNAIYRTLKKFYGLKIEFNKASAPLVKNRPAWYVANHMSVADFIVMGSIVSGTFAGKGDILKWPVVAHLARAVKYIGLRRSSEYNAESRAKIIKNFNAGENTIMFPEATTTRGDKLYLFRAGLMTLLFGDKGIDKKKHEVTLKKDVVVQPVSIRPVSIDGKDAKADDVREQYAMFDTPSIFKQAWKRMLISETRIEVTFLPPLEPSTFPDAKALINQAALSIASVVNPGQTTFEKAEIPKHG